MNSYSQKIVCISSAHAEDTRILRNFCRERTDWPPFRCITVNKSVNCVEIFPSGRTNHRPASRPALRPRAGLCITPAHAPAAFHALAALSAGLSRSKIPPAALPAAAPLPRGPVRAECTAPGPLPPENRPHQLIITARNRTHSSTARGNTGVPH